MTGPKMTIKLRKVKTHDGRLRQLIYKADGRYRQPKQQNIYKTNGRYRQPITKNNGRYRQPIYDAKLSLKMAIQLRNVKPHDGDAAPQS